METFRNMSLRELEKYFRRLHRLKTTSLTSVLARGYKNCICSVLPQKCTSRKQFYLFLLKQIGPDYAEKMKIKNKIFVLISFFEIFFICARVSYAPVITVHVPLHRKYLN